MRRPVRDADTELETPSRNFIQIRSALRELIDRLRIDWCNRAREGDPLGPPVSQELPPG
jgi:hypothetical protein